MIAALFVAKGGCYFGLPNVDPWDEARDARLYAGPWPVVAHPPCERWGRMWYGGPQWIRDGNPRHVLGSDGGCFAAALNAVRRWGGVLEHPADSLAWTAHGLLAPPRSGGWVAAGIDGLWTCRVEQGHYGHRAKKATWLVANAAAMPSLIWGPSSPAPSPNSTARPVQPGRRASRTGICQRMSRKQRRATPIPFRDLLISIAESARPESPLKEVPPCKE